MERGTDQDGVQAWAREPFRVWGFEEPLKPLSVGEAIRWTERGDRRV